jgi:hypothetical protein
MLRNIAGFALIAVGLLVAGCGGSHEAKVCGILVNGSKLCGADLKAYCEKFEQGSLDQSTTQACASVDAELLPDTPQATPTTLARECENDGGSESDCSAWANSDEAVGVTSISPDAANCIGNGGRVRYCVSDYME